MMDGSGFRRVVGRAASAAILLAAAAAGTARAAEPGVTVRDAWIRMLIPSRPAAGYFTLDNASAKGMWLTGASSPACGGVMLHESLHEGGQDRMVMIPKVRLPAHGSVTFAPGGFHLMCMNPKPAMKPGASVEMTLTFDGGGSVTAPFVVKGAGGQ
jgi:periplasmic copper chaperone A